MVEQHDIYITEFDLKRLSELLQASIGSQGKNGESLRTLEDELDRAHVVERTAIPQDTVTMNSRVRLTDVETGDERVCTLVFPSEANIDENKISVLAPIGTAFLGYRAGDRITWRVPAGMRTVRIEEVLYQPEAAGNDHL